MDLVSGSHSIGQNLYHLEWCPKYRYNMFRHEENKKLCENVLHEVAKRHHITITEMVVMPDHIHMVVELPATMSISKAAIGALWGAGMTEAMHVGNLTRYGKKYHQSIYWAKEIQGGVDWYPDRKSFDENLQYWKKYLIPYSTLLSLIVFILIPKFYELFNYLSSI